MRILTVGGGSGGHVTPVAAVVAELRKKQPDAEIRFWCDAKFAHQAGITMRAVDPDCIVETILSGKLRRYHGLPIWKQLLRLRTIVLPNIIDAFKLGIGTIQSIIKLVGWRPDVVFTKGGFVCLPVGIAAKLLNIPLVIHDSDAYPGLTNRILSRFADSIATGAPLKFYPYSSAISHYIGTPTASRLRPLTHTEKQKAKRTLGFDEHVPLLVVTGGGLGARSLNEAVVNTLDTLVAFTSVILVAGEGNIKGVQHKTSHVPSHSFQAFGYVDSDRMLSMLGAADIVVARAGATTLLELAALAKPSIIVPNEYLTGGHQVKNAVVYQEAKAAIILPDAELIETPHRLSDIVNATLLNTRELQNLSERIHAFSKPDAARDMAMLILEAAS